MTAHLGREQQVSQELICADFSFEFLSSEQNETAAACRSYQHPSNHCYALSQERSMD